MRLVPGEDELHLVSARHAKVGHVGEVFGCYLGPEGQVERVRSADGTEALFLSANPGHD